MGTLNIRTTNNFSKIFPKNPPQNMLLIEFSIEKLKLVVFGVKFPITESCNHYRFFLAFSPFRNSGTPRTALFTKLSPNEQVLDYNFPGGVKRVAMKTYEMELVETSSIPTFLGHSVFK